MYCSVAWVILVKTYQCWKTENQKQSLWLRRTFCWSIRSPKPWPYVLSLYFNRSFSLWQNLFWALAERNDTVGFLNKTVSVPTFRPQNNVTKILHMSISNHSWGNCMNRYHQCSLIRDSLNISDHKVHRLQCIQEQATMQGIKKWNTDSRARNICNSPLTDFVLLLHTDWLFPGQSLSELAHHPVMAFLTKRSMQLVRTLTIHLPASNSLSGVFDARSMFFPWGIYKHHCPLCSSCSYFSSAIFMSAIF